MRNFAAILAISLFLAGCGSGNSTATPTPGTGSSGAATETPGGGRTTASAPLAGEWEGKIKPAAAKGDDMGAKIGEGLANMFTLKLEIAPDDTFTISMLGIPQTGKLTRNGEEITLTPEKIMGMSPEEYEKSGMNKGGKPDLTPKKGKISEDGKTLTFTDPKDGGELVFTRAVAKAVGPSSVTADESKWVGAYKGKVDKSKLKPEQKDAVAMEQMMKLTLNADNTFVMSVGLDVDGKWKLVGDEIVLTSNDESFKGPDGKEPKMKIKGDELEPVGSTVPFTFVKK